MFINPKAWYLAMQDPIYFERFLLIAQDVSRIKPWMITRHQFYYEWMFLGWGPLTPDYPLHQLQYDTVGIIGRTVESNHRALSPNRVRSVHQTFRI